MSGEVEDWLISDRRLGGIGFLSVGPSRGSSGEVGLPRIEGTGISSATATAAVIEAALVKRAAGSLAMLLRMTNANAGGMLELNRAGGGGEELICCIIMLAGLSPRNGNTPVQIS